ncbi:MAG: Cache 3/Cache 2 fusion domain-containing protein [Deltaproteobacteria bacterium]|nr:Cache 3/Cache 2 fusion domain-containing protein [Deltaproteobacteria bacterium]
MAAQLSMRVKLLIFGLLLAALPMGAFLLLEVYFNQGMAEAAAEECRSLADAAMASSLEGVYGMAQAQNELAQEMVNSTLEVAQRVQDELGPVSFSQTETVTWSAINQFTKQSVDLALPRMLVGETWLGRNRELATPTPLVDQVRKLTGQTCTVFQRMNQAGDMLRVATNVEKLDHTRAIGTYIPAVNPGGKPNPVVAAVLAGQTFRGRAFVVNAWYITAYRPILDAARQVVGVLYVGVQEAQVQAAAQKQISAARVGKDGAVFLLNRKGEVSFAPQASRPLLPAGEALADLAARAVALPAGKEGSLAFRAETGEVEARFRYFAPWDWVIVAAAPTADLIAAAQRVQDLGREALYSILLLAGIILVLAALASLWAASSLAGGVHEALGLLAATGRALGQTAGRVAEASRRMAEDTGNSAASLEQSVASLQEMEAMTESSAQNAQEADQVMSQATRAAGAAGQSLHELQQSMAEITRASGEMAKIIKSIDEIAFQTNLLALNAAVEAARAGEAGSGFAVVADEVRALALRSAEAAKNTNALIEDNLRKIQENSSMVTKTGEAFTSLSGNAGQAAELVALIARASAEQSQGLSQINQAALALEKSTDSLAGAAGQTAGLARELDVQSADMNRAMAGLIALVDGQNGQAKGPGKRK